MGMGGGVLLNCSYLNTRASNLNVCCVVTEPSCSGTITVQIRSDPLVPLCNYAQVYRGSAGILAGRQLCLM